MSEQNTETVNTRHLVTGKLQRVTPDQYKVFEDVLEIVPDDAKEIVPEMFRSGRPKRTRSTKAAEEQAVEDEQAAAGAPLDSDPATKGDA